MKDIFDVLEFVVAILMIGYGTFLRNHSISLRYKIVISWFFILFYLSDLFLATIFGFLNIFSLICCMLCLIGWNFLIKDYYYQRKMAKKYYEDLREKFAKENFKNCSPEDIIDVDYKVKN